MFKAIFDLTSSNWHRSIHEEQALATGIEIETSPARSFRATARSEAGRKLIGGGSAVIVGSIANNILSFLFSFVIARLLRPTDYATFTACLSLLVVVGVPAGTLQLITARYIAMWEHGQPKQAAALTRSLGRLALIFGATLSVMLILAAGLVAGYLKLNSLLPIVAVSGILLCSFLGPVYRGVLQGQHRFGQFAIVSACEYAFRLALGTLLVVLGWHAEGALGGVLLGVVSGAALGWWYCRGVVRVGGRSHFPWQAVLRWAMPTLLVQAALSALLFQDTLWAKHFFSDADAGAYAGLATAARLLVYVSGALSTFLFPIVARAHGAGRRSRLIPNITLALTVFGEVVLLAGITEWPTLVLRVIVGNQYIAVSAFLPPLAGALAAYAVIGLLVSYLLATGNRLFWLPVLVAPVAQAALMWTFHTSLAAYVHTMDGVMGVTMVILLVIYALPHRTARLDELVSADDAINSAIL